MLVRSIQETGEEHEYLSNYFYKVNTKNVCGFYILKASKALWKHIGTQIQQTVRSEGNFGTMDFGQPKLTLFLKQVCINKAHMLTLF